MIPREVKRDLYDKVVIPTLVYGSETWPLSGQERSKIVVLVIIDVFEKYMWHMESDVNRVRWKEQRSTR